MAKDIRLGLAAADGLRVPMPLASLLHDWLLTLLARGGEALDWSAIGQLATRDAGLGDLPSATEESKALSKALIKRGFRFVGPTTVYAAMQSLGVVNDHMRGCPVRWRSGSDRPCIMHADEDWRLTARAAAMGVVMQAPPGERDGGDGDGGDGQHVGADASRST